MLRVFFLALCVSSPAFAGVDSENMTDDDDNDTGIEDAIEEEREELAVPQEALTSRGKRIESFGSVMAHIETIGFPFAFHRGIAGEYIASEAWTVGAVYSTASLGLGFLGINAISAEETLQSLDFRYYFGNSAHWLFGVGQRNVSLRLGEKLLTDVSGETSHIDVVTIDQNLIHGGIANRWMWKSGLTLGVDWLDLYIPVGDAKISAPYLDVANEEDDRDKVSDLLKVFEYVPTLSLLRLQIGYTF
jgi:hypothetical protein